MEAERPWGDSASLPGREGRQGGSPAPSGMAGDDGCVRRAACLAFVRGAPCAPCVSYVPRAC